MLEKNGFENFFLIMGKGGFYVVEEITSKDCDDIMEIAYMIKEEEYKNLLQLLK